MKFVIRFLISLVLFFIIAISSLKVFERMLTEEEIEVKVTTLEKRVISYEENLYLVHTEEEIFENRDDNYHKKFDSETLMARIRKYGKYKVLVCGYKFGFKVPFISERRNILKIIK